MILIFDTETTGKAQNYNAAVTDINNWPRMVQLAWQIHNNDGVLVSNKDYIIRPDGYDIPYNTTKIHGITTQMAKDLGKALHEVLEEINKDLAHCSLLVGHNIQFDLGVLGCEFHRAGIETSLLNIKTSDTMLDSIQFCKIPTGREGVYKYPKLSELFEKLFNYPFDEAHNAAADVNSTAQSFFELVRLKVYTAEQLQWDNATYQHFQTLYTKTFQAFDVEIREQVNIKKNRVKKTIETSENTHDFLYFPIHNHSIYSNLSSSLKFQDLIDNAVENQFPAVGLCDLGNLMGAFKFISAIENHNSDIKKKITNSELSLEEIQKLEKQILKAILACEFYISDRPEQKQFTKDDPDRRRNAVLVAKNLKGYKNLAKLSSFGFIKGFYAGVPRISKDWISEYKENLIALTGGLECEIPFTILNFGEKLGEEAFCWWHKEFGDNFYVQIQNHGKENEDYVNQVLLGFAEKHQVKILGQNECFYAHKNDARIHDMLYCIKDGEKMSAPVGYGFGKRKSLSSDQYYLKNRKELQHAFEAFPEAFDAYEDLYQELETYSLKQNVLLPKFDIPEEFVDSDDALLHTTKGEMAYLRHLAYEGAIRRYTTITDVIKERLDFELDVIKETGYPGYFLIVQDFCKQARKMDIWVGPGRGSAAGSVVAYCIEITNVDPIEYDLLFERFLNPDRLSMPDIDIDFDDEGRDRIIQWVVDKYGKEKVAQIITYSILGGKSAIKDAGRVMEVSIPETTAISKLIPNSPPSLNIKKVLNDDLQKFKPEDHHLVKELRSVFDNPEDPRFDVLESAYKMEGCIRNTGIHACGLIITPEDIINIIPVSIASKNENVLVSQFDNSVAESAGLLKMDFLGLKNLSIMKGAIQLIKQKHNKTIVLDEIPLNDSKTYQLFREGRTVGIFQYESAGMQKYLKDLKPDKFDDLIAMNALYRPGPIQYIPNFIKRKHGIEETQYDLPEMQEILKDTYGITVYQEQVMLLSQKLANFTKGQADSLRKAMGKKDKPVLDKMKPEFIKGGLENNLNENKLNKIWSDWEAFASYAFNKSHSTCYALIGYHTAYLKANYPAEYMASVMSSSINNISAVTLFMEDCKSMGIEVLGPNVNESQYKFSVNNKGQIRFGLGAIKGMGEGSSEVISSYRAETKYESVYDFFERIPFQQLNKKVVESLVYSGAFDELDQYHRAQYFQTDAMGKNTLERLQNYAKSFQDGSSSMENSLFAEQTEGFEIEKPKIDHCPKWQTMMELAKEKEMIGLYLSSHPLDLFKENYLYIQGKFDEKTLGKLAEFEIQNKPESILDLANDISFDPEDEIDITENSTEEIELETIEEVKPEGPFAYIPLNKVEAFRNQILNNLPPKATEKLDEKGKKIYQKNAFDSSKLPQYTLAGLVTSFSIFDGKKEGEKNAIISIEDYSGTYQIRLFDKDYMKFKNKIDDMRFLVFKIVFSPSFANDNVYINLMDVQELSEVFEKWAKILVLKLDYQSADKQLIQQVKTLLDLNLGSKKLSFQIDIPEKLERIDMNSANYKIEIQSNLIKELAKIPSINVFLN